MKADQVGVLCIRRQESGPCQVLLVTSRDTGRWIIPKGWRAQGLMDHEAAAREAREEAGVTGLMTCAPIGDYTYSKAQSARPLRVDVYLLAVRQQADHWPEQQQRRRAWFDLHEAVDKVREPELRALIKGLRFMRPRPRKDDAIPLSASR